MLAHSKYLRMSLAAGTHQFPNAGFSMRNTYGVVLPGGIRQSLQFDFKGMHGLQPPASSGQNCAQCCNR